MAPRLIKVRASVVANTVTTNYDFLAPPNLYTGDVASGTGITQVSFTDASIDNPNYLIAELIRAKIITRIIVEVGTVDTTTDAVSNKHLIQMFCTKVAFNAIDAGLVTKIINTGYRGAAKGGTIIRIIERRRAIYT